MRNKQKVLRLSPVSGLQRYHDRLKRERMKIMHDRDRMMHKITNLLNHAQHRFVRSTQQLAALGPQNVLSRGFSIIRKPDGQIVRSINDVVPGDVLEGILLDGNLKLMVVGEPSISQWQRPAAFQHEP
jgi:exodeoxyribonuclease VII large subunit